MVKKHSKDAGCLVKMVKQHSKDAGCLVKMVKKHSKDAGCLFDPFPILFMIVVCLRNSQR
jgi:hypothetical protein